MRRLVIPAAGKGQRFRDAGYMVPKPMLPVLYRNHTMPMWLAAAGAFRNWRDMTTIVVTQEDSILMEDGIMSAKMSILRYRQEGAALTILSLLGEFADDDEVLIVNSDQFFTGDLTPWFNTLSGSGAPDGSMLTFQVSDPNDLRWSYAQVAPHDEWLVTRVAEKQRISPHATAGAYYFRQWRVLRTAICRMVAEGERYNGEFYLAPVYNQLIKAGMTVRRYDVGDDMRCVGTPEQYRQWSGIL